MATLVGIDWPVNSVGVLPDVDPTRPGYVLPRNGDKSLAEAALVNAKVSHFIISFLMILKINYKTILENYRIQHGKREFMLSDVANRPEQKSRKGIRTSTDHLLHWKPRLGRIILAG